MLNVDSREPHIISVGLQNDGIPVTRTQLTVGDYSFSDKGGHTVLITRKAADLFSSIFSGHFSSEIQRCMALLHSEGGGQLWWLQEGAWVGTVEKGILHPYSQKSHNASPKLIPSTQISMQVAGLYYLTTASMKESAVAIAALYRRGKAGWPSNLPLRLERAPLKWHRDDKAQRITRLMALWPRLSERSAAALLAKYGSIALIMYTAENADNMGVPGIGPKMIANFREVIS